MAVIDKLDPDDSTGFRLRSKTHYVACWTTGEPPDARAWSVNFYRRCPREDGGGRLLLGSTGGTRERCIALAYDFMLLGEAVVPPKRPVAVTSVAILLVRS
jgi:hypothetical protein